MRIRRFFNQHVTYRIPFIFFLIYFSTHAFGQNHGKLDIKKIEQVLGMKGEENNGEYKVTVAQNDLDVKVDGSKIIPPMGMGSQP